MILYEVYEPHGESGDIIVVSSVQLNNPQDMLPPLTEAQTNAFHEALSNVDEKTTSAKDVKDFQSANNPAFNQGPNNPNDPAFNQGPNNPNDPAFNQGPSDPVAALDYLLSHPITLDIPPSTTSTQPD
jgi:hypothetical protein